VQMRHLDEMSNRIKVLEKLLSEQKVKEE